MDKNNIVETFLHSLKHHAERPALEVDEVSFTYKHLWDIASRVGFALQETEIGQNSLAGILAYRSTSAFAGILGVIASGNGYVPFNPHFPVERTRRMLELSGVRVIVVGQECLPYLGQLLEHSEQSLCLLFPECEHEAISDLKSTYPQHSFISSEQMSEGLDAHHLPANNVTSTAYLLFTSGSTGLPKGIEVSHRNVLSYIDYVAERYDITENDRCSQTFDMTFDLSVHDMFLTWQKGACLCCLPRNSVMMPTKFINDKQISVWFSVPSVPMFMDRMRMLSANSLPTLKLSLFCGEPLPAPLTEKWQQAAGHSIVENLYGPTEATIAITHYRWDPATSIEHSFNNIVPIGGIFDTQEYCIVNDQLKPIEPGHPGELCVAGSQITNGYLNNPKKTAEQFVKIPEKNNAVWYRTGDLVREDTDGCMYYHGRVDNQVKILGYRVELQEIDTVLRKASETQVALSVAWPLNNGNASGIVGFLGSDTRKPEKEIIAACKEHLPDYMVPSKIKFIDEFPLNANGKLDRLKLKEMLEEGILV